MTEIPNSVFQKILEDKFKNIRVHAYTKCTSTMDIARSLRSEADSFLLVVSDQQSLGRGRRGNQWKNSKEGIYLTLLIKTDVSIEQIPAFSLVSSLAVINSLSKYTDSLIVKWPNDVLDFSYRKISGVLLEHSSLNQQDFLSVGIGINLDESPEDLSSISLSKLSELDFNKEEVIISLVDNLINYWSLFSIKGFSYFKEEWLSKSFKKDTRIIINNIMGEFIGIDSNANLLLNTPSGIKTITTGDVRIL